MQGSNFEPDSEFGDKQVGFIDLVYGPHQSVLNRKTFVKKLESSSCNWIFNDGMIRDRMRKYFMDNDTLESMGFWNKSLSDKLNFILFMDQLQVNWLIVVSFHYIKK